MYSIYHDLIINTPKEKVFAAFTNPEQLNNWWTLKSSGNPILNTEYNLNFTDEFNWFCLVSKVELNKCFHLTMTVSSKEWHNTTFGIDLENRDHKTLLKFNHLGWLDCSSEFRNTSYCWALLLNDLKNYLEKGIVIPFNKRS